MAGFTWLDYVFFLIFFANAMLGLSRGIYKEIISTLCLIVAFIVAIQFTTPLASLLNSGAGVQDVLVVVKKFLNLNAMTSINLLAYGVSFALLFIGTFSLGEAMNYYTAFEWFIFPFVLIGRLLGGLLGFVRGYAFNVVLILLLQLTPIAGDGAWSNSFFIPRLQASVSALSHSIGGFPAWR